MRASTAMFNSEPSGHLGLGNLSNCCNTSILRSIRQFTLLVDRNTYYELSAAILSRYLVSSALGRRLKHVRRFKEIAQCTRSVILNLQWGQN